MGSPEGTGYDDDQPPHTVYLDAFWIDKTDVTNAMFKKFVNAAGYVTDAEKAGKSYVFNIKNGNWELANGADWLNPQGSSSSLAGLEDHPVVQVSWDDANASCKWAGVQLPSEAQWEKAARGTDGREYPWGDQNPSGNLANFADANLNVSWADKSANDGYQFTSPVGFYPKGASPYGALDMAGNVWQWVNDWYDAHYYASSPASNPQGPSSGTLRVLRGGSWFEFSYSFRSALRLKLVPSFASYFLGFRCARTLH
jgi:formylglycine-generating enzyme required for sulfatase activity